MNDHPYYFTWGSQPSTDLFSVQSAEHDEFIMSDGQRIYDFICTSFQTNFGHSHPTICDAIRRQLSTMPVTVPKASFELKRRVSDRLLQLLGLPGGKLFYTISGSESVENALKMARQLTGCTKILARQKSYHGSSLGALSVTGDWRSLPHFRLESETVRIPEPEDDPNLGETKRIVQKAGTDTIAAMILETISGTNGVSIPSQAWFDGIQQLCRDQGILLIIDEVLCGFGRSGPPFAFQAYGLQPDFVCLSKGISGGYIPFGAVWTGPTIVNYYDNEKMVCGLTSYAHPLGLAALEGVLDILADEDFQGNKRELEQLFSRRIAEIGQLDCVSAVRCRGLIAAVDFRGQPAPSWDTCRQACLHVFSKDNCLILAPPFVSTPARLNTAFDDLTDILKQTPATIHRSVH